MPDPKELNLDFGSDGVIRTIWDDKLNEFTKDLGEMARVCRLSNVEWEELPEGPGWKAEKGWTIRAAHDPELALRWTKPFAERVKERVHVYRILRDGELVFFSHREEAIQVEKEHYDQLMPPKETE